MKYLKITLMLLFIVVVAFSLAYAGDLKKGKKLFNNPKFANSTNEKSCNSCHPKGKGINGMKKTFTIMGEKQKSVEDAVNFCIKMALKGEAIDKDSQDMKDITSYIKTLKGKKKKAAIGC